MMLSISPSPILAAVVVFVSFCDAFYMRGFARQAPRCLDHTRPCKLRFIITNEDNNEYASTDEICSCASPLECGTDWDDSEYVISRDVVSYTNNITFQAMFCNPVEPKNICKESELALIVTGSLAMPQDIESYNCRCNDTEPLTLHERSRGEDYMIHHTYVCADSKPFCEESAPCMTLSTYNTTYGCECSPGLHCRAVEPYKFGYCSE